MNPVGVISYGAAALGFLVLAILLVTSWNGQRAGGQLIAAIAVTFAWATVLTIENYFGAIPIVVMNLVELGRDTAWIFALVSIARGVLPRQLAVFARVACVALLVFAVLAPVLHGADLISIDSSLLLSRSGLVLALIALIMLEQLYRNSSESERSSMKYFCVGVGTLFAYDLFMYSQSELLGGISIDVWNARGIISAFAVPMIVVAARRNARWSLNVFVSRQAVFYTTTFIATGIYLVIMAIGGYYVRVVGGSWGRVGQIIFFAGALLVLASLLGSEPLRRRVRVFISKHFYRNKFDYRLEWLRFIKTLSSTDEADFRRTAIRAIAQIFSSPGGILFLREDDGEVYVPYAAWPMHLDSIPQISPLRVDHDLPRFLSRTEWIIDTRELLNDPGLYNGLVLPPWLEGNSSLRIISPLLQLDQLVGFVVLYDPQPPLKLTYEDRDLLKTVGRHVATHIAQHDADQKLAESRQFEAYNRLTAFMMHDLKNSIAQLKLIVANAQRHKHKPEFIDDAVTTIDNTVRRMTRLMEQLSGSGSVFRAVRANLTELAQEAVRRCAARSPVPAIQAEGPHFVLADPDRLTTVIEHVVRNAQDAIAENGSISVTIERAAGKIVLSVRDTGSGMDAAFIRDRLFRPFDSTKGAKGMGIGAYQVREYIRLLGGKVEVQSSPGRGTRFAIALPAYESRHTSQAALEAEFAEAVGTLGGSAK